MWILLSLFFLFNFFFWSSPLVSSQTYHNNRIDFVELLLLSLNKVEERFVFCVVCNREKRKKLFNDFQIVCLDVLKSFHLPPHYYRMPIALGYLSILFVVCFQQIEMSNWIVSKFNVHFYVLLLSFFWHKTCTMFHVQCSNMFNACVRLWTIQILMKMFYKLRNKKHLCHRWVM